MNYKLRLLLLLTLSALAVVSLMLGFRQGLLLLLMIGLVVELLTWLGRVESDYEPNVNSNSANR
ncbi:hypothetical protein [uncultured Pseudoteredinibacter sp.]|uniref:hypothetical protein n=1 Tax=uncultured Pseudoteredinibacter sp. TaxID=1641701 RepID=UPI00262AD581|nr:hypothetical protein [uncultured Pseudoteredinibacter sp.]